MFFKDKTKVLEIMKNASADVGELYKPIADSSKRVMYKFYCETEVSGRELWIDFVDVGGRALLVAINYIPEQRPYKETTEPAENLSLFMEESFLDDNLKESIKAENVVSESTLVSTINQFLKKTYGMVENQ